MNLSAISLFSGAGGMDVGFSNAGFNVVWANDIMLDACETYRANHGPLIECGDMNHFLPSLKKYDGVDLVFGGPPCQGFSVAGKMNPNDERSKLVFKFLDVVGTVRPRAFVMENVKALGVLDKWSLVREALFKKASDLGYNFLQIIVLNASEFGVPQKRERMFFIGIRDTNIDSNFLDLAEVFEKYKTKPPKVGEIIKKLGKAGNSNNPRVCNAKITIASNPILRRSPYAGMLFNGAGRPIDPNGYANTLPASMGGNKTPIVDEAHIFDNQPSWIESYHSSLMSGGRPLGFQEAPTFLRRLTIDEALQIQSFPSDYIFKGRPNSIYTQIGNAVPCKLASVVAEVVKEFLIDDSRVHSALKMNHINDGYSYATV